MNRPEATPPDRPGEAEIDALLAGDALGDLDETERERLTRLLRQRPGLQQRLDEFRTTLELLPLALPTPVRPPARLRRRLLGGPPRPRAWVARGRRALLPALLGLGLLGLGLELQRTRAQLARLEQTLAVPPAATAAAAAGPVPGMARSLPLRGLSPAAGADGAVIVTGHPGHNLLVVEHLPPPPAGHTYRLWARVNGRELGCVPFTPDAGGHVAMAIPSRPTGLASSVHVTLEKDPRGMHPTGLEVMAGRV